MIELLAGGGPAFAAAAMGMTQAGNSAQREPLTVRQQINSRILFHEAEIARLRKLANEMPGSVLQADFETIRSLVYSL